MSESLGLIVGYVESLVLVFNLRIWRLNVHSVGTTSLNQDLLNFMSAVSDLVLKTQQQTLISWEKFLETPYDTIMVFKHEQSFCSPEVQDQ